MQEKKRQKRKAEKAKIYAIRQQEGVSVPRSSPGLLQGLEHQLMIASLQTVKA